MNAEQKETIAQLYLDMYDMLESYARSSLRSGSLAEEAVQETFRIACQKAGDLCGSPNPYGWLVLTLKNTIRNMKTNIAITKRILRTYVMTQCKDYGVVEDKLDINVLYANVADTEEFKLLVELALLGRSHEEMAQSRGISVNACKKRMQRAKEILQKRIKKDVTK